jgi:predicted outer membrane protein
VTLEEVEASFASRALIFDDCRYAVRAAGRVIPLAGRAVLFTIARALAEAWPDDVSREELGRRAFRLAVADESLRARLRVEIGRLRKALKSVADVEATKQGFVLRPKARQVVVLARPMEEEHAAVLAFLADGESWPTSALALALGTSQRSVQRALDDLAAGGKVQAYGAGRARRWMTPPLPGIATTLLLPAPLPGV